MHLAETKKGLLFYFNCCGRKMKNILTYKIYNFSNGTCNSKLLGIINMISIYFWQVFEKLYITGYLLKWHFMIISVTWVLHSGPFYEPRSENTASKQTAELVMYVISPWMSKAKAVHKVN